jgi:hypothetical protein
VSYSMWVQRFGPESDRELSREAFRTIFGPHMQFEQPEFHFFRIVPTDGRESGLYANLAEPLDSIMASHFSFGVFLDLFVEFARQCNAVIYTQDGAAILTHLDQRASLPSELQHLVFLASNGAELESAILRIK